MWTKRGREGGIVTWPDSSSSIPTWDNGLSSWTSRWLQAQVHLIVNTWETPQVRTGHMSSVNHWNIWDNNYCFKLLNFSLVCYTVIAICNRWWMEEGLSNTELLLFSLHIPWGKNYQHGMLADCLLHYLPMSTKKKSVIFISIWTSLSANLHLAKQTTGLFFSECFF